MLQEKHTKSKSVQQKPMRTLNEVSTREQSLNIEPSLNNVLSETPTLNKSDTDSEEDYVNEGLVDVTPGTSVLAVDVNQSEDPLLSPDAGEEYFIFVDPRSLHRTSMIRKYGIAHSKSMSDILDNDEITEALNQRSRSMGTLLEMPERSPQGEELTSIENRVPHRPHLSSTDDEYVIPNISQDEHVYVNELPTVLEQLTYVNRLHIVNKLPT